MFKISNYVLFMALLAKEATRSNAVIEHTGCNGVISSFVGECTYANFIKNLSEHCNITELFRPYENEDGEIETADYEAKIEELCKWDAPTAFVEIQGTYQKDRQYFFGGG